MNSAVLLRTLTRGGALALTALLIGCGGGDSASGDGDSGGSGPASAGSQRASSRPLVAVSSSGASWSSRRPGGGSTAGSSSSAERAKTAQQRLVEKIQARLAAQSSSRVARDASREALTKPLSGDAAPKLEGRTPTPPRIEITMAGFERVEGLSYLRTRVLTNLPDGGELVAQVSYAGEPLPALMGATQTVAGRAEIVLGPIKGFLSSGHYTLSLKLDPVAQTPEFLQALKDRFGPRASRTPRQLTKQILYRQATLLEGKRREALLHYEEVWSTCTTLLTTLEETVAAVEAKERFHSGERLDRGALRAWYLRWQGPLTKIRARQRTFISRYASPPHPELITHIRQVLGSLLDLGEAHMGEMQGAKDDDSAFFKAESFAKLVRTSLYAIDLVIKGIAEEVEVAEVIVARLKQLLEGPDDAELSEAQHAEVRVERYLEWANKVKLTGANAALGDRWGDFLTMLEAVREDLLRHETLALGAWFREVKATPPKGLVLTAKAPVMPPAERLTALEQQLAAVIAATPKPDFIERKEGSK